VLSKRVATTTRGDVTPEATTVIAVTGEPGLRGKSLVAATLSGLLRDLSRLDVALVEVQPNGPCPLAGIGREPRDAIQARLEREGDDPARLRVGVPAADDGGSWDQALDGLVAALAGSFAFVVLDVSAPGATLVEAAEGIADVLVRIVTTAAPAPLSRTASRRRVLQVVNLHNPGSARVPISDGEPFVLPDDASLRGLDPVAQTRRLRGAPRASVSVPLRRLARKILGTTVGIALGGGAAFGIAHIGVLQVLEANGVPIDVLAGTSMGSVVALSYAAGTTPDEMAEIAKRMGRPLPMLSALDITLTRPGLLAGRRMVDLLMPYVGQARRFEDLLWPARAVATDIERGERVEISSGALDAAIRASCSVPVIWSPVRSGERVLVDGVLVDPVPADVAYEMGAELCFAVNVIPRPVKGAETFLTKLSRQFGRFNPLSYVGERRHLPNLLDIYMNSMQVLWHELGHFRAIGADVRINPDLSGFTWTDFHRPLEIMELGAAAAEQALPAIRRVLAEKIAERTRPRVRATA
jgi:NTE family protein